MNRIIWIVFAVSELLGPAPAPEPPPAPLALPPFATLNIVNRDSKAFP